MLQIRQFAMRLHDGAAQLVIDAAGMFACIPGAITHLFQIVFARGNVSWSSFPHSREYMYS